MKTFNAQLYWALAVQYGKYGGALRSAGSLYSFKIESLNRYSIFVIITVSRSFLEILFFTVLYFERRWTVLKLAFLSSWQAKYQSL